MPLDAAACRALAARLAAGRDRLRAGLDRAPGGLNPDSGPALAAWLEEALGGRGAEACRAWPRTGTGRLATDAGALAGGAPHLPPAAARVVLDLLLPYKAAERRRSWLAGLAAHAHPLTGRLHARHDLAGTVSGRMSSADPNLQAVPRDAAVRALFRAPPGRALVVADYDQMELRVAALLAGEERLLAAHRAGRDAHVLTAAALLGKAPEAVTEEERRLAKAANFGLLYGQGAEGLRAYAASAYGVAMTAAEARRHRAAWLAAHPRLRAWQARVRAEAGRTLAVRTPAGRERRWAAGGFRATQALSHPVQGGAAEVLLAALARLRRGLEAAGLDAAPVAAVHDELVVEADAAAAPAAARVLEGAMVGGMLEVLPGAPVAGLVAARVGPELGRR
jgi:DNA polymerase I